MYNLLISILVYTDIRDCLFSNYNNSKKIEIQLLYYRHNIIYNI